MNILIPDSWLREYLKTDAKPYDLARDLSLASASIERIEKQGTDHIYDVEVTTNRPDLMSIVGLAREAAAVLPHFNTKTTFSKPKYENIKEGSKTKISISNDSKLVNRVCAVALKVAVKDSPQKISKRLEACGIRSLNNIIDITNYIMRETGHPAHVFDLDRLGGEKLTITTSKTGERVTTLDNKEYTLPGGDIVARNEQGEIVDLLGIMGLKNSVVTDNTKNILLFINNNDPHLIRKTSMKLGIRTEAAILNEKNIDPEAALDTLKRGVELYQQTADATVLSNVVDIYPNEPKIKKVTVTSDKISSVIGTEIKTKQATEILNKLGFETKTSQDQITAIVPSWREKDISIEEDIVEEVARVYGYHKLPSIIPSYEEPASRKNIHDSFYWEKRIKEALKYWGFVEVYTYSMVSEEQLETSPENAVTIDNPLTNDHVYLRTSLVPSLLQVERLNKQRETLQIFELSNIYLKNKPDELPTEKRMLAGLVKQSNANFFSLKGIVEQLCKDLGITNVSFKQPTRATLGADVFINSKRAGEIEILNNNLINFELDAEILISNATTHRVYSPKPKTMPIVEDVTISTPQDVSFHMITSTIYSLDATIKKVELLDTYQNKKTLRIYYQDEKQQLTNDDVSVTREKVYKALSAKLHAEIDE